MRSLNRTLFLLVVISLSTTAFAQKNASRTFTQHEKKPCADLGNGYYQNPIIPGNFGDPSLVRVGEDYYMAHSRGNGAIFWHSRDLVNWKPVTKIDFGEGWSGIWAVDLQFFNNKFHLYMPVGEFPGKKSEKYRVNHVITADNIEGPWSKPIRIDNELIDDDYYTGIDPGFIQTPDGKKYLYTDHGYVMPLDADGLKATGKPILVYKGWKYPETWIVEGECLESPKLFMKDGYYYLVSAQGGTSGPSTSHMAVVARSKSPIGPWDNSPFNPLVHTYSESEIWWQQGHATIFDAPDGSWWTVYHARLNNFMGIGRQTLLMPIEWTADGWPVIKNGYKSSDMIPKPVGENIGAGMPISDNFMSETPGIQWNFDRNTTKNLVWGNGKLEIDAKGSSSADAQWVSVNAVNKSFEVTVEVECPLGANAGLIFGNNEGVVTDGQKVSYNLGDWWRTRNTDVLVKNKGKVFLKIKNYRQDLSFFCSDDGVNWKIFQNGARSGIYSVKLFASGSGKVVFKNFTYFGLE